MIGKLHPEELKKYVLKYRGAENNSVVSGPDIGEDSAVIKISSEKYLLVSSDPIVGADNENIGKFLIEINVNDIAAKGGDPKYIMLNIIVPEHLGKKYIESTMEDIDSSCKKYGISIIGGHTEITNKYTNPFITATILGETDKLFSVKKAKKEDLLFLIGKPALEGTYILYNAHNKKLSSLLTKNEKKQISSYIKKLSVYNYSKSIKEFAKYMHDPTEGGIWGGLSEIEDLLNNLTIEFFDNIKLPSPVKKITDYFKIDPLKLISSGALLAIIPSSKKQNLIKKLNKEKHPYAIVGKITDSSDFKKDYKEALWDHL